MLAMLVLKIGVLDERTSQHTILLREILGQVSAGGSKRSRIPPWLQESGRMLLKGAMSLAAPVLWAWLTWIGAGVVLGYKLAVKFIIGS
jgi:hypothetical protein